MTDTDLLTGRLTAAGVNVASVTPLTGGVVAVAGRVTRADGSEVFAKTLSAITPGLFEMEAEGLRALRELGGARTPEVLLVRPDLLVLEAFRPPVGEDGVFWQRLGRMVADLHTGTVADRFGWHHDGWLGRLRQENTWSDDGHAFFAERRILRWLSEPLVAAAFQGADRRALEHLCARLPELVPEQPAVLTHGDLWLGNVVADGDGRPALIDPAVSYIWPEVDLSMLWCTPRPPESERFFTAYAESAILNDGWVDRMPLLNLRELLSVVAHDDDDWGAADLIRKIITPFRPG